MNHKDYRHLLAYAATLFLLLGCAESEKITEEPHPSDVQPISFSIDLTQDWYAQKPNTRAILERSQPRHIEMQCSDGSTAYLLETTRTGIESKLGDTSASPISGELEGTPDTRGALVQQTNNMSAGFYTFCYMTNNTEVYSYEHCDATGHMSNKKYWPDGEDYLNFYAVFPQVNSDQTNSRYTAPTSSDGLKYAFTLNPAVASQVDLMYASTGNLAHNAVTAKQHVPLWFKHALTAVRFKLGDKPNFGKTIKSISLKNVYTEGTLILPKTSTEANGNNASWDFTGKSKDGTITLDDINFAADDDSYKGNVIKKSDNEEYFLMIPQDLSGVVIEIVFTDNAKFSAALSSGSWSAGTTVDYSLSNAIDNWNYTFTMTSPAVAVAYDGTSATYGILSYRTHKTNNTQVAVPWKIVSYEEDPGTGTYGSATTTPPEWLTELSLERGDGGTTTQSGTATLKTNLDKEYYEEKVARDNVLKAGILPSDKLTDGYYDLSDTLKTGSPQNTANCYVISAPGKYKLPLVYGNAITNGAAITSCYTSVNQGSAKVLSPFVNHKGEGISGAYLSSSGDTPETAELVWSDISSSIITNPTVSGDYLFFEIKESEIESGNAVVAVKNSSNVVMWSWHLWFAPKGVLNPIECTNYQGYTYKFTTETLGYKPNSRKVSTYSKVRKVRLNLLQKESGNTAAIIITQNSDGNHTSIIPASSTLYQFGRKDAFPGVKADNIDAGGMTIVVYPSGSITKASGSVAYKTSILNPGKFYYTSGSPYNWCSTEYNNAWSANNKGTGGKDSVVVKTVYDPCPAGYHMPASNAFTGFTTTGNSTTTSSQFNVSGSFNKGWILYSYGKQNATESERTSSPTIFFPAANYRMNNNGQMYGNNSWGFYWSAVPQSGELGCCLIISEVQIGSLHIGYRSNGYSVRPVQE